MRASAVAANRRRVHPVRIRTGRIRERRNTNWNQRWRTVMATIEELLSIDGVVAAGEYQPDGKLVGYKANMEMTPELAEMAAQFCATVTMLFGTLSGAFSASSGMNWTPTRGWAFSGGDWT